MGRIPRLDCQAALWTSLPRTSFNEQYGINNPVNRGNPNLYPETINTLELAFSWQANKDAQVNFNLFRYGMRDIVSAVPNPAPAPGTTYNNVGSQDGSGGEVELVWDASRNFSANYSYQRSTDRVTRQDAGYVPRHHLYARADWRIASGWMISPQINHVADRKRSAGDTRPPVPDYTTFDLALRTANRGKSQWNFSASIRNLFNADVREPSTPGTIPNDIPTAPRAFYLQAVYRM